MERVKGIEPSSQAWEARVLPLNHTRNRSEQTFIKPTPKTQWMFRARRSLDGRATSRLCREESQSLTAPGVI